MSATYDQVPDFVSNAAGLTALRAFIAKGVTATARLMVFGDSTLSGSTPNANSTLWSSLVVALGAVYGNVPAVTYLNAFDQNHSQNPYGVRSIWDNTGIVTPFDTDSSHYGTCPISYMPPGARPAGYRTDGLGIFFELMTPNLNASDPLNQYTRFLMRPDIANWVIQDGVGAKIHAVTGTSSGEMAYKQIATVAGVGNWAVVITDFGSPLISGTTAIGLQASGNLIKTLDLGALTVNGGTYLAVKLSGNDGTKYTNILGATYYNRSNPAGVHCIPFAVPGGAASSLTNTYPNCDVNLDAFGIPDAVWIQYGLNDVLSSSAANFKANMLTVIGRIRAKFPAVPLILVAPWYRIGLSGGQQTEYDQYPGVLQEIVAADAGPSMTLNGRGFSYKRGLNATTYAGYLVDGLHDLPALANIFAAQAVELLVSNATPAASDVRLGVPAGLSGTGTLSALAPASVGGGVVQVLCISKGGVPQQGITVDCRVTDVNGGGFLMDGHLDSMISDVNGIALFPIVLNQRYGFRRDGGHWVYDTPMTTPKNLTLSGIGGP